ncbi:MAG: DNA-processing protein DprA [Pseudomonadota bacterium]
MDDLPYWLALHLAPGIGPVAIRHLIDTCGHPRRIFEADLPLSLPRSLPDHTRAYFKAPDWDAVEHTLRWAKQADHHLLAYDDPRYPPLLHQIHDAPAVLFVIGDPSHLSRPQIAMVGSRNPSAAGKQTAREMAGALTAAGYTVTSGLALGIDTASHEGALEHQGATIAVTGTGLDRLYPARNKSLAQRIAQHGTLVSEFPLGTPPLPGNFPRRNRIISGLSLGTLVVEAGLASGSLITAHLAIEQGREVFAIPGSIHNPMAKGCHHLIREGAKLVETIEDILHELPPLQSIAPTRVSQLHASDPIDAELSTLLDLIGYDPISPDTLIEQSGLTADRVSSMLLTLELRQLVTSSAGRYCRLPEKANE